MADDWDNRGVQANIAFPDGRVLIGAGGFAPLPPKLVGGRAVTLNAGPLTYEVAEPLTRWRMTFDGNAYETTIARQVNGQMGGVPRRVQIALEAANRCSKPLMVHVSNSDVPLGELICHLRPGDIVTHCFHGTQPASILDKSGKVISEARDARDRGVIFDIGHGLGSLSYDISRAAMEDGFPPDTISSDIHSLNIDGPVFDLPTTMSKFLNLGMPLEEVIARATIEPARVIDRSDDIGHLGVGAVGDVAIFEVEKGAFELTDSMKQVLMGEQRLTCRASVRNGKVWWTGN